MLWTANSTTTQRNLTALIEHVAALETTDLVAENALLQSGHSYVFTLRLQNFLGFWSAGTDADDADGGEADAFAVTVEMGSIPELVITAGVRYALLRPQQLNLFAEASVAVCPGQRASAQLSYRWTCAGGASSFSVDPRYFKVSAFTFNASTEYAVTAIVTDAMGRNNTASTVVAGRAVAGAGHAGYGGERARRQPRLPGKQCAAVRRRNSSLWAANEPATGGPHACCSPCSSSGSVQGGTGLPGALLRLPRDGLMGGGHNR